MTLDLPGHGAAGRITASLPETAELVLNALPREPVVVGGYSFGARVALHVALADPERVRALVLVSASRGILDLDERRSRRHRDDALAAHLEEVGTDVFLSEWLSQPLFSTLGRHAESDTRSRYAAGLAESLRHAGTGTQEWLGERLATLDLATLIVAGQLDAKFVAEAHAISAQLPHATLSIIPGAGHAAHLEQPELVARAIEDFLG